VNEHFEQLCDYQLSRRTLLHRDGYLLTFTLQGTMYPRTCALNKHRHNEKYGRTEVQLSTFLILAPEGGEWLASRPGRFILENAVPETNWTEDWWEPKLVWQRCRKNKTEEEEETR
jgi:hypothetical protein